MYARCYPFIARLFFCTVVRFPLVMLLKANRAALTPLISDSARGHVVWGVYRTEWSHGISGLVEDLSARSQVFSSGD